MTVGTNNSNNRRLVFIDTNVWFSAFYGSKNSEQLLRAHIRKDICVAISQRVMLELVKNVKSKIPNAQIPLKRLLNAAPPVIIQDPKHISQIVKKTVEKKDQCIFQSAINGRISLFVTGNLKDFRKKEIEKMLNILVVSPREAITLLKLSPHHIL